MYLRRNAILSQITKQICWMDLKLRSSKKSEWALQRGGHSAHSVSWLLSSPQQPLETEDPPTVSLAPQYTSQHLCRAITNFLAWRNAREGAFLFEILGDPVRPRVQLFHRRQGKNFSIRSLRGLSSQTIRQESLDEVHDWSLPSSALKSSARALACDLTSVSFSPSIMTRTSDSVPE